MRRSKHIPPPLSRDRRKGGSLRDQLNQQQRYKQYLEEYQEESNREAGNG